MLGLIKKIFTGLLTCIVSASNHTKCVSLKSQQQIWDILQGINTIGV